jgi:hypothetical protein
VVKMLGLAEVGVPADVDPAKTSSAGQVDHLVDVDVGLLVRRRLSLRLTR